jgi:uroporphyrinogen decarboxylase
VKEAMNSRERILAAIRLQELDRVPTDIWATPEVWAKLKAHFGESADINAILHIDGFAGAGPKYVGPALPAVGPEERVDAWGIRHKRQVYQTGEYYELSHHPLAFARQIDDLDKYAWPKAEWFDFSEMPAALAAVHDQKATSCGYMAPFYYHNLLRGLEQSLIDPLEDPKLTDEIVRRITDFFLAYHRRMFEACQGLIDVTQVTDDLGMQTGPMISLATFGRFYKPHIRRCIDLAREFGVLVFHHDDGAMRAFLPELVEMGINVLNPIQWRCLGMDRAELKRDFGKRICFHGGMDNQRTMPFGSEQAVRQEARDNIDILASDGTGYIFAPCHNLQAVSPVENIIAMYDEAWKYGRR